MTAAAAAAAATRALRSALEDCAHPARPPSTDRFRHHLLTHLHAAPCPIACSSCPQVAREQAQKDKVRFEKAQAERVEMVAADGANEAQLIRTFSLLAEKVEAGRLKVERLKAERVESERAGSERLEAE